MADIGWGIHSTNAGYGRPFDQSQDFALVDYQDSLDRYKDFMHASHGMIYMKSDQILWNLYPLRGAILMQLRFDGNIGFPGGLRDDDTEPPEDVLNREMQEEINLDLTKYAFTHQHYAMSHLNEKKRMVTHFFTMEVTEEQYGEIEKNVLTAKEYGIETYGVIRVPLTVLGDGFRGLPVFLANKFAGNAKDQLLTSIRSTNLIPEKNLNEAIKAHEEYMKTLK